MDCLFIQNLSVSTQIGVHAWEQRIKQQLLIDITIPADFSNCQDELTHTIDYDALCQKVTYFVESQSFQLIETVANQVAQLIKEAFKVDAVTIAITKPHAVKNAAVIKVSVSR